MARPRRGAAGVSGTAPARVLAVIDWLEVGGAQQHLLALACGLSGAGYRFTVATSGNEPLAAAFRRAGVPIRTLARRPIKHRVSPVFTARLATLARGGEFDLIHGHLHAASVAAAAAARVSGLPLVLTHHSMNTWRPTWQTLLGRWADRQADAVIAVATNVAAAAARDGVPVRLIPNSVDVPARVWSAAEVAHARAQLGLPPQAYVISFVGRFSSDKNPLLFVEAAAQVAARCPQAHFLLVGDGPLRPAAETRVQALGLAGRLTWTGFRSDAVHLHSVSDVLALTSDSEATPLVVLEAMAAARPVVATAVGDVAYQVTDGETGYVVPPRDADRMADALVRLADGALRRRLGEAARQHVIRHFTLERTLAETAAVYQEVLRRRGRARSRSRDQAADVLPFIGAVPPLPASGGHGQPIIPDGLPHHLVDAEASADAEPAPAPELLPKIGPVEEGDERLHKPGTIIGLEQKPGLTVDYNLRHAPDGAGDDGTLRGHGFEHRQW